MRGGDHADPGCQLKPAQRITKATHHHLAYGPEQTSRQDQHHAQHLTGKRRGTNDGDNTGKRQTGAGKLPPCRTFLQHHRRNHCAEHHLRLHQQNGRRGIDHRQAGKAQAVLERGRNQRNHCQLAPVPPRQRHEPDKHHGGDGKAHSHQQ